MKAQLIAGLILVGATSSLHAQDVVSTSAVAAPAATEVADSGSVPAEVQFKTFGAGNQMLIDISEQVGNDLDAKLEQEVGGEVTVRVQARTLLVSNN